jgi:hypothetical protein
MEDARQLPNGRTRAVHWTVDGIYSPDLWTGLLAMPTRIEFIRTNCVFSGHRARIIPLSPK